ncbi:uncharacterized protein LOC143354872 [Halictus rubicundus]|uniref:uncharacterized protein LOC143354872 n=1 Tax=Halictus rubicundus TaxID=77578 RepID=UPI004036D5D5
MIAPRQLHRSKIRTEHYLLSQNACCSKLFTATTSSYTASWKCNVTAQRFYGSDFHDPGCQSNLALPSKLSSPWETHKSAGMLAKFINLHLLSCLIWVAGGKREFFREEKEFLPGNLEKIVSCVNETARSLFNPERRIDVINHGTGTVVGEIAKAFSKDAAILVGNRMLLMMDERIPSYIVIENNGFRGSRGMLLPATPLQPTLQYLFVTGNGNDDVLSFARDLRNAGYRDVAFLVFDRAAFGTVIRANQTGKEITLKSVGSCSTSGSDVHRIPAFVDDARRYCPPGGCSIKYGIVADETVRFWRQEDKIRVTRNESLKSVGALLVEHFGDYYNINVDSSAGNSMTWSDAIARLISRDIDVLIGPRPRDLAVFLDMEIVCWYMYRDMVFAGLVKHKTIQNDILLLLTPFHYLVWLSVVLLLIVYLLLLSALRKLANMGLIRERVPFEYVSAIMLAQGIHLPRKHGLRLVLLIWMLFSLYLSTTYNSTFTSSLAEVESDDLFKNLEQVRDSGQPVGGPAAVRTYFNDSTDRHVTELGDRYKVMEPSESVETVFSGKGVAVVQKFTVDRLNWDYRSDKNLRLYSLQDPVFRFPVFLYSRKGYLYRRPLRGLVTRYREIGMIQKLDNVFLIDDDKEITARPPSDDILSIKHLKPIFEMFFMCQGVSLLILGVEILHVRIMNRSED